jgi:hypothetical protein
MACSQLISQHKKLFPVLCVRIWPHGLSVFGPEKMEKQRQAGSKKTDKQENDGLTCSRSSTKSRRQKPRPVVGFGAHMAPAMGCRRVGDHKPIGCDQNKRNPVGREVGKGFGESAVRTRTHSGSSVSRLGQPMRAGPSTRGLPGTCTAAPDTP